jgi:predicted Zn finger-like uncharacterized protein
MIIICPQCTARFAVKAEAIGEKGRKVKCAKCAHSWFQAPDAEALAAIAAANVQPEPEVIAPIPQGSNVPVVTKKPSPIFGKIIAAAACFAFMLFTSLINANSILPKMAGVYGMFGIYDSKDLALSDVVVKKVEDGNYQNLMVAGKIINSSDTPKHLPNVRVIIYDKDREKLKTITLDSEGVLVNPGEGIDFQNQVPRIPASSTTVVMDLGNSLDLASR